VIRRALVTFIAAVLGLGLLAPATAGAQESNEAVAVNTTDGASIFRLAFSVRRVHDGVVDERNTAVALASCADCQTVALAFQVVLVSGDVDVVTPVNQAAAVNVACAECLTYASATQLVLGFDGPVRLTRDGYRRLAELQKELRALEEQLPTLDAAALDAAVQAAKAELLAVFTEEVVEPGRHEEDEAEEPPASSTTTTSTTTPSSSSSSSTTSSTTSTTTTPTTSSTVASTTTTTDATG
jgi:putative peptide zinc metalloprotease protein